MIDSRRHWFCFYLIRFGWMKDAALPGIKWKSLRRTGLLCSERGSLTISLSLVMAGFLALSLVLQQVSALRIYQVELAQATALQIEGSLAKYDRELVQRYGLWGLREESLTDHIFINCTELSHRQEGIFLPHMEAEIAQEVIKGLHETGIAGKQIKPYMQFRAPLALLTEYYLRFKEYQGKIQKDIHENKSQIESDYREFERERGRIETILAQDDSEESQRVLSLWENALHAGAEGEDVAGESVESYLSDAMSGFSSLENFMHLPQLPVYDQLLTNEYVMGHFSYATDRFGIPENEEKTWGGWRKRDLKVQNPFEIESIAWQDRSGKSALNKTKLLIMGVRLVQNFAAIQSNSSRRAKYVHLAQIIHYAILALTGGSVYIPVEILVNAFILLRSAFLAYKDCQILLKGKSVSLIPKEESFPIFYHDFLRLLLCFSAEENKIRESIFWIELNLQGQFYTGIRADVYFAAMPWKGGIIKQEAAYDLDKK